MRGLIAHLLALAAAGAVEWASSWSRGLPFNVAEFAALSLCFCVGALVIGE